MTETLMKCIVTKDKNVQNVEKYNFFKEKKKDF